MIPRWKIRLSAHSRHEADLIEVNGVDLTRCLTAVTIEAAVGQLTTLTLTAIGEVDIEGEGIVRIDVDEGAG